MFDRWRERNRNSLFFIQKVRKTTADQLYSAVLTYDDILPAERLDDVLALLSDTSWWEVCSLFCLCFLFYVCLLAAFCLPIRSNRTLEIGHVKLLLSDFGVKSCVILRQCWDLFSSQIPCHFSFLNWLIMDCLGTQRLKNSVSLGTSCVTC